MTTADTPTYSLAELAQLGDVTIRTIRYYIGQGLLPSPIAEGPNTRYTAGHVDRLLLIRELQREHLPLAEIRSRLERLDDTQVRELIEVGHSITEPRGTAFDYIQSVLAGTDRRAFSLPLAQPQWIESTPAMPSPTTPPSGSPRRLSRASLLRKPAKPEDPGPDPDPYAALEPSVSSYALTLSDSPALDRSQWDRISLAPDVELHIRRPLSRLQNRRVERLLAVARDILEEDQP